MQQSKRNPGLHSSRGSNQIEPQVNSEETSLINESAKLEIGSSFLPIAAAYMYSVFTRYILLGMVKSISSIIQGENVAHFEDLETRFQREYCC